MVEMIDISTFRDSRGALSVVENGEPFDIARAFWVTAIKGWRGKHYHRECSQILIPILGTFCVIVSQPDGFEKQEFIIGNYSDQGLLIPPGYCISYTAIDDGGALLILADRHFDNDVTIPCGGE